MDALADHDEQALRRQLRQARESLDALEDELRAVDAKLADLSTERQRHALLAEACGALEKLSELDGAGLFWGERSGHAAGDAHVQAVRGRIDAFQRHLAEIESRRQAVVERIGSQQEDTEVLEADVFQAQEQEERRKLEWVIEREIDAFPAHAAVMPWSRGGEDDERFHKSFAASILFSVLLGLVLPQIDLPLPEPWEVIEVPERLVRLIREERPPPPPPVPQQVTPKEPEPKELLAEAETPTTAPQETPKPAAESKGILAFREKFSGLADSPEAARLGARARISHSGDAPSGLPQRSMVTTQAAGSSGGIKLAALSRDLGGGGRGRIEGVEVGRATSSIGAVSGSDRPRSGGPSLSRTDEEIQIVFDRHKAALYRLYNRELRRDPTLKGQMVLRITIEPDGSVSLCELQSTDMAAPQLSAQVVGRVRTFDFGAKSDIPAITIVYPIDFLPAT
jgi:hypothetical protein